MKALEILSKLTEQENNEGPSLGPHSRNLPQTERHRKMINSRNEWLKREQRRKKFDPSRSYAHVFTEIQRQYPDQDGEPIYIEVDCTISGSYVKGYSATRYEPGESDHFEDIYLEWAEPVENNPEGGPLTMQEKVQIDQWFDTNDAQDYAQQELLDTL